MLGGTGLWLAVVGYDGLYWAVLGYLAVLGGTGLNWAVLGCGEQY